MPSKWRYEVTFTNGVMLTVLKASSWKKAAIVAMHDARCPMDFTQIKHVDKKPSDEPFPMIFRRWTVKAKR